VDETPRLETCDCRYENLADPPFTSGRAHSLSPARLVIPFSGGIDSTLLAAFAHLSLPPCEPIDLSNVCFAGGGSPDRISALDALAELSAAFPRRDWRLICVDKTLDDVDAEKDRCGCRSAVPADRCHRSMVI
jgi:hypothetical protein